MNEFEIVNLGPYIKGSKEPFTIAFVYAPGKKLIIKGMESRVMEHISQYYAKSFFRITHWKRSKRKPGNTNSSRGTWGSMMQIDIDQINLDKKRRYRIIWRVKDGRSKMMIVRRIPHRWLDCFNSALPKETPNVLLPQTIREEVFVISKRPLALT